VGDVRSRGVGRKGNKQADGSLETKRVRKPAHEGTTQEEGEMRGPVSTKYPTDVSKKPGPDAAKRATSVRMQIPKPEKNIDYRNGGLGGK